MSIKEIIYQAFEHCDNEVIESGGDYASLNTVLQYLDDEYAINIASDYHYQEIWYEVLEELHRSEKTS